MRLTDRDVFVKLATKRVENAIKSISLIGNLSNKSNYDYRPDDVEKIFKALRRELNACKKRFEMASKAKHKILFTLD